MRLTYLPTCALLFLFSLFGCGDDESTFTPDGGSDAQVFMDGTVTRNDGGMLMMNCPGGCEEGKECMAGKCVAVGVQKKCGCVDGDAGDGETCYPEYGVFADDKTILFVKAGTDEGGDGSVDKPFRGINEAVDAAGQLAPADFVVAIAVGSYVEDVSISGIANLDISCACPDQVEIRGDINLTGSIANAAIDGCTIAQNDFDFTKPAWPTDCKTTPSIGVNINPAGASGFQIRNSVIAGYCTGVRVNSGPDTQLCLYQSRICMNEVGVELFGAPKLAAGVGECLSLGSFGAAVKQTLIDENKTYGLRATRNAETIAFSESAVSKTGRLGDSSFSGESYGLYFGNLQEAVITRSLVEENGGIGIAMINLADPINGVQAEAIEITNNEVLQNVGGGIALQQLQSTQPVIISDNLIGNTLAFSDPAADGGDGLQVMVQEGTSFNVSILNNFIDASARDGILLDGVGGTIETNTISLSGAYGIILQNSDALIQTNTISGSGTLDQNVTTATVHDAVNLPQPMP